MSPLESKSFETVLTAPGTGHPGTIRLTHPVCAFAPTPASMISFQTIVSSGSLLVGAGVDWGCGCGILTVAAARLPTVEQVIALDISRENVEATRHNLRMNGVEAKARALVSNSFVCLDSGDQEQIDCWRGELDFVIANPPTSGDGDGFNFRRTVLRDSAEFLKAGGVVFLSVSSQYGKERILGLIDEIPGYSYDGMLATTPPAPFDLMRSDLLDSLRVYVMEEKRGGLPYEFVDPGNFNRHLTATEVMKDFEGQGTVPLSRWQTHLYRRG